MVETMKNHDGIGLAAPQVHQSLSLFITDVPKQISEDPEKPKWVPGVLRVFINPKIVGYSQESWTMSEGCLSIPKLYGEVIRPIAIKVEAIDLNGQTFTEELSWLEARAVMHENDHINGVLFIDRMDKKERKEIEPQLHEIKKKFLS
jgi:peptide deformylase